jgi:hypothetical protein
MDKAIREHPVPLLSVPDLICVEYPWIDIQYPVKAQDADSRGDQYDNQRDHVREDSEIVGFLLTLPSQR